MIDAYYWIVDYLSFNGTNSENMKITSDVPQGSLLGPKLFSIFTDDFPYHLDCNVEMLVDESTPYLVGN